MDILDDRVAFVGDTHGNTKSLVNQLKVINSLGIYTVFICGDFGIWGGYSGSQFLNDINRTLRNLDMKMYVTLGNHENYDMVDNHEKDSDGVMWFRENICVFPRPYRFTLNGMSVLSLGGAPSIDFEYRTLGYDWWAGEFITSNEACEAVDGGHADIMITHDAPDNGTVAVQTIIDSNPYGFSTRARKYAEHGRHMMSSVVASVQPDLLIHGHYHVSDKGMMPHGGDIFSLSAEGGYGSVVVLDTSDGAVVEWLEDLIDRKTE
jgi:Icc-related predicted phosphoesterase